MAKLKHNPFPFIFTQGKAATKLACLELFGLADSLGGEHQLALLGQQRPDGAFPSHFDSEHWGIQETIRHTLILLQAGLPAQGVNAASAIQFILDRQNPDGGWCENPTLEIPPMMTWLSVERSITWITADAVELLRLAGRGQSSPCQAALKCLRTTQNQQGGWPSLVGEPDDPAAGPSDPDTTAQIAFLLGDIYGEKDPAYRKGRDLFERHLDEWAQDVERGYWIRRRDGRKQALDAYTLTHLLLSSLVDAPHRLRRGYDCSDPRVARGMAKLIEIQREDGGWRPFYAEESSPVYTVLAIKCLVLSGAISRKDLEEGIQSYLH